MKFSVSLEISQKDVWNCWSNCQRFKVNKLLQSNLTNLKSLGTSFFNRNVSISYLKVFSLIVCFVALRPKSTAMVIAGRSVHLTTLFSWASLNKQLTSNRAHTFACNWQQPFMNDSAEGRRMTVEIISWSISTKVWDRAGVELATPGSAVSFASVTRHVTDCATRPGIFSLKRYYTCILFFKKGLFLVFIIEEICSECL